MLLIVTAPVRYTTCSDINCLLRMAFFFRQGEGLNVKITTYCSVVASSYFKRGAVKRSKHSCGFKTTSNKTEVSKGGWPPSISPSGYNPVLYQTCGEEHTLCVLCLYNNFFVPLYSAVKRTPYSLYCTILLFRNFVIHLIFVTDHQECMYQLHRLSRIVRLGRWY